MSDDAVINDAPPAALTPEQKFRAEYNPDTSKWTGAQRRFYSECIADAYREAHDAQELKINESKGKDKLSHECTAAGSLKSVYECVCANCAGRRAAAEKQNELTGYDWRNEDRKN